MAMTPAHDAFTLNNRYSASHAGRSPSPTAVSVGIGKLARRRVSHGAGHGSALVAARRARAETAGRARGAGGAVDWEVPRKTLHASIGFFVVPLYTQGFAVRPIIGVLCGALVVIGAGEVLRLRFAGFERVYEKCLGALMRDSEKHKINGVVWYLLGALIVLNLFPLDIAVVSILILSWADTAASTFGRLWGRRTGPLPRRLLGLRLAERKSWAGFAAASVTAGIVGGVFWGFVGPLRGEETAWAWGQGKLGGWMGLGFVSVATGMIGGVAEALGEGIDAREAI